MGKEGRAPYWDRNGNRAANFPTASEQACGQLRLGSCARPGGGVVEGGAVGLPNCQQHAVCSVFYIKKKNHYYSTCCTYENRTWELERKGGYGTERYAINSINGLGLSAKIGPETLRHTKKHESTISHPMSHLVRSQ